MDIQQKRDLLDIITVTKIILEDGDQAFLTEKGNRCIDGLLSEIEEKARGLRESFNEDRRAWRELSQKKPDGASMLL